MKDEEEEENGDGNDGVGDVVVLGVLLCGDGGEVGEFGGEYNS